MELILIVKALAGIPLTVHSNAFPQGLWGEFLSSSVSMHATRLSVHTLHSIQYTVQYTVLDLRRPLYFIRYDEENNENANEQIGELINYNSGKLCL